MSDDYENVSEKEIRDTLIYKVEQLKSRRQQRWNVHFGMVASLGGVIIVPMLLCILVGGWLDEFWPQFFSWRLNLLLLGFIWGLINGYFWLKIENEKISRFEQQEKIIKEKRR